MRHTRHGLGDACRRLACEARAEVVDPKPRPGMMTESSGDASLLVVNPRCHVLKPLKNSERRRPTLFGIARNVSSESIVHNPSAENRHLDTDLRQLFRSDGHRIPIEDRKICELAWLDFSQVALDSSNECSVRCRRPKGFVCGDPLIRFDFDAGHRAAGDRRRHVTEGIYWPIGGCIRSEYQRQASVHDCPNGLALTDLRASSVRIVVSPR